MNTEFNNILQSCSLCPRACGANRAVGKCGVCGADNTLHVARAALHAWEEPPISARAGSGTVFFSNCPLKCVYCQNVEIAHAGFGEEISTDRLSAIFLELQEQDAANINIVTGMHYVPWILPAIDAARRLGLALPIVWNTSGYESPKTIQALRGYVDIYLTDFKYWKPQESTAAARYSAAPDYFNVADTALELMFSQVGEPQLDADGVMQRGVVLRHLLLPGCLEDSKRILAHLWQHYGGTLAYSIMNQYTPMRSFADFPELNMAPSEKEYEELLSFADELGMQDYFWQEGGAAQESFIPPFDSTGVMC